MKSFIARFTRKGLLYYGIAFLAVALTLNGAFAPSWSPLITLCGAFLGILALFVYDLTLMIGDKRSPRLMAIYVAIVCAVTLGELLLSPVFFKTSSEISFVPHELSAFLGYPWFGIGFQQAENGCLFLQTVKRCGFLGLLAMLTHFKHLLEVAIRRFSFRRLLLIALCMAIAFSPLKNLDLLSTTSLLILYCLLAGLAELELEGKRLAIINNLKKPSPSRRARVLFPFIEAGKGHIIPERAVCEIFKQKYGDKVEVIESKFYTETNDPFLESTEKLFAKGVQTQNKNKILSLLCRTGNFLAGDVFAQYVLMAMTISGRMSKRPAAKHLLDLDADLIFTTHWSIPFYLNHIIDKKIPHPYTVMLCPDVYSNGMFNMDCNRFLMPMKKGHDKIAKFRMYAGGNTEVVPFPLREEIYSQEGRREELRGLYGIEDDAFVVTLCDGGYGMANLEGTVEALLSSKEKMTLIALCGTNKELYERMQKISTPKNITLIPVPFTDKVLEYLALSDLFVGKSGANSMAEPAFLGVPIIVTRCATYIERHIKDYYVHTLKGAMYIPSPKLAARKIIELAKDPHKLDKYKRGLEDFRRNCGAEAIADMLYEALIELGYNVK